MEIASEAFIISAIMFEAGSVYFYCESCIFSIIMQCLPFYPSCVLERRQIKRANSLYLYYYYYCYYCCCYYIKFSFFSTHLGTDTEDQEVEEINERDDHFDESRVLTSSSSTMPSQIELTAESVRQVSEFHSNLPLLHDVY